MIHDENWISNRLQHEAAVVSNGVGVANQARDGACENTDVFLKILRAGAGSCSRPPGSDP